MANQFRPTEVIALTLLELRSLINRGNYSWIAQTAPVYQEVVPHGSLHDVYSCIHSFFQRFKARLESSGAQKRTVQSWVIPPLTINSKESCTSMAKTAS